MEKSSRTAAAATLAALLCVAPLAVAEETASAALSCPEDARLGRVSCTLVIRGSGAPLVWADALVTEAPTFARPLRARVGFSEGAERKDAQSITLPISLVATAAGKGELVVKARVVVCPTKATAACVPLVRRVRASVRVTGAEPH